MTRVMLMVFLILTPGIASAQGHSLKELLIKARESNPEIKALEEKIKAMEAREKIEGSLDDPTLEVEMMDLSTDSPFSLAPGSAMQTKYRFRQMFPFPGKLSLREGIAAKVTLGAKAELMAKTLEVYAMVKEAYFEYAYVVESIKTTEEIKELLFDMERSALARYSTGQATQQDVIKIQVETAFVANDLITLDAQRETSIAKIRSLINPEGDWLDPRSAWVPREPSHLPTERVNLKTEELINAAFEKNPEINMAKAEAEAMTLGVELAKKSYYPDFMLGLAPTERDGEFESFDFMFQINIPLWRSKYDGLAKEALAYLNLTSARLAAAKNVLLFKIRESLQMVDASERALTLYETGVLAQAKLSFDSALKNYQSGRSDFTALLDSERELKKAKLEYLKTLYEYRKNIAAIERLVGEDF